MTAPDVVEDYRLVVLPRPSGWVTLICWDDGVELVEDVSIDGPM